MKTLTAFALVMISTLSAYAKGPFVSGGERPPASAVVLQSHLLENGAFDQAGSNTALDLAVQHMKLGQVVAITQRAELQYPDRKYLCIEYANYEMASKASMEFKQALANNLSIDVVSADSCD